MRSKVILALVLSALGIFLTILGGKEFKSEKEVFRVADFRATVPAKKTYPAVRHVGRLLIVSGLFFLTLAIYQRVHKPS